MKKTRVTHKSHGRVIAKAETSCYTIDITNQLGLISQARSRGSQ